MRRRSTVLVALAAALAGLAVGLIVDRVDDHERVGTASVGGAEVAAGCGATASLVAVDAGEPSTGVVVVRPDGSQARATPEDWVAGQPDISPDQSRLVVARDEGPATHLWTVGLDGTDPQPLTTGEVTDTAPRWSPNGGSIAHVRRTSSDGETTDAIVVVGADGSEGREVARADEGAELAAPEWSPDGTRLAYVERRVDPTGATTAALLTVAVDGAERVEVGPVDPEATAVDWHPDGSRLLVSSVDGRDSDMALVDLATGASTVLARAATGGRWSLGGTHVVHHTLIGVVEGDTWRLVERPLDATGLGATRDVGVETPTLTPDDGLSVAACQR